MEQIGKYKILAHIGHGAMGSVEKAEAPDGTIVAIKTLFPQFVYEEEYVKRFKREAALAKKLSHPNVVKVLEVGEDQDGRRQYMVMEYIDGKTLAEYMHDKGMASIAIKRSSKLNEKTEASSKDKKAPETPPAITTFSPEETIKIIRQLAGVLQAAADISLLHRDIKPQNILLDKKGNAKLLDFGLAKDTEALVSMLSMTGQSIGTPPYMSPEQHEGGKGIDMRSDLYSLGCTTYHILAGRPPFPGPTASAFARQHCDDVPEPVHKINPDCPLNLSQVIDRLLAKNPENRHQNPVELIEDLNRVERGEVPLKLYKPKKTKKHNPVRNWLTVAAAVIIVAGCFIGWNIYKSNNAVTIIKEAMSDAQQMIVKHDFDSAKNVLDNIISEYIESNPEQVKQAEALRVKLIERYGKWIAGEAVRERQKEATELSRVETSRKRKLHNCLRNAARLKNNENRVREAEALINKAYQLCNSDSERAKVAAVEKQVQKALVKMRPWAAVADFTLDKSVKAELTGSAVAVKLEQALGSKYRLVTRSQVNKALRELRFQTSDLADRSKAKQFGKLVGAEYLISGSVIQLGREITVACQIFHIETGAIRQTAEVSAVSVEDFNYMIRDAAQILAMSNTEKRKYMDEKFNYPKYLKAGNAAFLSCDYENAIRYFKRALSAKRTNIAENMLKLASEKAEAKRVYNECKGKYELTMKQGYKFLREIKLNEAETAFTTALKINGYNEDKFAKKGIKIARGKTSFAKPRDIIYKNEKFNKKEVIFIPKLIKILIPGSLWIPFPIEIDSGILYQTRNTSEWKYFSAEKGSFRATFPGIGSVVSNGDTVGIRISLYKNDNYEWFVDNSIYNGSPNVIWTKSMSKEEIKKYRPQFKKFCYLVEKIEFDRYYDNKLYFKWEYSSSDNKRSKQYSFNFNLSTNIKPLIIKIKNIKFIILNVKNNKLVYILNH